MGQEGRGWVAEQQFIFVDQLHVDRDSFTKIGGRVRKNNPFIGMSLTLFLEIVFVRWI